MKGFIWDSGNETKNWESHSVTKFECEEVFFNEPFVTKAPCEREERFILYGETDKGRRLFLVYTVRDSKIRVISARDMSRKERKRYEETVENEKS